MFCHICGEKINENLEVCPKCGSFIEKEIVNDEELKVDENVELEEVETSFKQQKEPKSKEFKLAWTIIITTVVIISLLGYLIYYYTFQKNDVLTCIYSAKDEDVRINNVIKTYSFEEKVLKVKIVDSFVSDNENILDEYEKAYQDNNFYDDLNTQKKISRKPNKLKVETVTKYKDNEYQEIGGLGTVKDGKVDLQLLKGYYETAGYECE